MSVNYFLPRDPADPYKFRYMHQLSTAEIDHALYNMEQRLAHRRGTELGDAVLALAEIQRELLRRLTEKEKDDAAGVTKAAYIGEFRFSFSVPDGDGDEIDYSPSVPWTTIKEIMAAIRARAALEEK